MEAYVAQRHPQEFGKWHEETIEFEGIQAYIRTDYSAIWDHHVYRHEAPLQMLDTFQQYLEELAKQQGRIQKLRELVKIIVSENRLAVLWSRLLIAGSRFPSTLGKEILPLSWTLPILIGYDTRTHVGEFLIAIFSTLGRDERERIERAIMRIPEALPADRLESGEYIRNSFLGCLATRASLPRRPGASLCS
jgi:hypothetical protein